MSYTPTIWTTGDTITATKLNKMEQGIAEGGGGVGFDVIFFKPSGGTWQSKGISYADAHEKMSNGEPLIVAYYDLWTEGQHGLGIFNAIGLNSNNITFFIYSSSVPNITWTANGITYND